MALSVRKLYEQIIGSFNAGMGSEKFDSDFQNAINNVLDELSLYLSSAISHPADLDASISELNEDDSMTVLTGLEPYLIRSGQVHVAGEAYLPTALALWAKQRGIFQAKQSMATQASNLDDDGHTQNDIIGLGYRGG